MRTSPSNSEPASTEASGPALSWQEREIIAALKRLANARSQYDSLLDQQSADSAAHVIDPSDVDTLLANRAELERLRGKAKARFGGNNARSRTAELEATERLTLERMGFASFADFQTWRDTPTKVVTADPAIVEFARREVAEAEAAWLQIQALEIPEPEPVDESSEADDDGSVTEPLPFTRPAAS